MTEEIDDGEDFVQQEANAMLDPFTILRLPADNDCLTMNVVESHWRTQFMLYFLIAGDDYPETRDFKVPIIALAPHAKAALVDYGLTNFVELKRAWRGLSVAKWNP